MKNAREMVGTIQLEFFDDSSFPGPAAPKLVIYMGGVAAGKTTARRLHHAKGYVAVEASDIYAKILAKERVPYPDAENTVETIGRLVAFKAVNERRNIVTELCAGQTEELKRLIDKMVSIGYEVDIRYMAG
ncbi:MAG TPA: zeta toxin family protein, partial [bacterium]|nr:zeta toxin family protein [bacterium]